MIERQPVGLPLDHRWVQPTNAPATEGSISVVETPALRLKRYTDMKFLRADAR